MSSKLTAPEERSPIASNKPSGRKARLVNRSGKPAGGSIRCAWMGPLPSARSRLPDDQTTEVSEHVDAIALWGKLDRERVAAERAVAVRIPRPASPLRS